MCLFIRPLAFARVGGAVDVFNVLGGFFILYLPFFVGFTWFLGLVFSVCVFGESDRGRGLMPDLWSGSLATRTTGQASAAGCRTSGQGRLRPGPLVRPQLLVPDLWSGSLLTRTTGQATAVAVDAGLLVRVACDPDHGSGINVGC